MERPLEDERDVRFNQFTLDLIDGRNSLESEIKAKATAKSFSLSGYTRDNLHLPGFIDIPQSTNGISCVMGFEFQSTNGTTELSKIIIDPADSAPIVIKDDHGIIIQQSGDFTSPLPSSALNETLFSLFPQSVRYKLTVDKAIEVIAQLSPESSTVYEFSDDSVDFLTKIIISNTETVDDSIFSLEVTKTVTHPSGLLLGTRMNLADSIQRQIAKVDITQNSLAIDVHKNSSSVIDFFDTLADGRVIPVAHPTRRHIDDIMSAIERLDQNRFDTSDSGAA